MPLRIMKEQDQKVILAIDPIIFPEEKPWTEGEFNTYFRTNLCFVSYDETTNQINGYVFAHSTGRNIHISNIGVHPNFAGKGIGSQLMEQMIKAAQQFYGQHTAITLQVRKHNTRAIDLYKKYGFNLSEGYADFGFQAMKRPLNLSLKNEHKTSEQIDKAKEIKVTSPNLDARNDIIAVRKEILRLRTNALSLFSIGNKSKANLIEKALNSAIQLGNTDVRLNFEVRIALAKHRIFGFFGIITAKALTHVDESCSNSLN